MSLVLSEYLEKRVPLVIISVSEVLSPGWLLFTLGSLAITARALMGPVMAVVREWYAL